MTKVYYNGKYHYFYIGKKAIVLPLPGDTLIELGVEANQICFSSLDVEDVEEDFSFDIDVFSSKEWLPGKSGKKVFIASISTKEINLSNIDGFKVMRAGEAIFPITFKGGLVNLFHKIKQNILDYFKK